MQKGERIQEGPMVFLRGGHFCLNLVTNLTSLPSSTNTPEEGGEVEEAEEEEEERRGRRRW